MTGLAMLPCLTGLLGCAVAPPAVATSGFSNWQIEAGTKITPPSIGGFYLYGALQTIDGSQVSATLNSGLPCTRAVGTFTGAYNSAAGTMTLSSTDAAAMLTIPANIGTLGTGTLGGGGDQCLAVMGPTAAVGVEIAALNGSFSGPVTEIASTLGAPIASGTVSVALTQTATPTATGLFPLTGTLTFSSKSCTFAIPVTGTIGGIGVGLSGPAVKPGGSTVDVAGYVNLAASQITATSIVFSPAPCSTSGSSSTTYAGTLAL